MEPFTSLPSVSFPLGDHEALWARNSERFPFEDAGGRFYLTVEHYYQASKFFSTDPAFAEHVRLACSAEEAIEMAESGAEEHPVQSDWDSTAKKMMGRALRFKLDQHEELQEMLLDTDSAPLLATSDEDSYWGLGVDGDGENHYGLLLVGIRQQLQAEQRATEEARAEVTENPGRRPRRVKRKRGKRNIYSHADGSATFDIVSSDRVRISVTDEEVVIPMSALPGRAKTTAHKNQYFMKKNPEANHEVEEEDDVVDPELAKEYMFRRPTLELDERFAEEMASLIELGFTDCDANFAALLSGDGGLESALDMLIAC